MTQEIEEIIKKNLPAQVGDVLKTRLEKADKDEVLLKQVHERNNQLQAEIDKLNKVVYDYRELDTRNRGLETREKAVAETERLLEIEKLKFQLNSEKEKTEFSKNVALGLVRNIEYRKTIFDSESQSPYPDNNGNMVYPNQLNKHYTETKLKD